MNPKVSVIIPNYNHARFLAQRIESVLGQSFGDLELIILDDASTDRSHVVLTRYHAKPRVRIVMNSRNSGSAFPQWNRGIALAKGEYVWIAESDDAADPHFLETLVPVLDANLDVGLAYTASRLIDVEGTIVGDSLGWTQDLDSTRWQSDFTNNGVDEVRRFMLQRNTIPNASAVLTRRSTLLAAGPVDADFRLCGDWLHWGKVLLKADVAYVARPLNFWRLQSSNSRSLPPGAAEWKEGQRVIRQLAAKVNLDHHKTNELLIDFANHCIDWLARSLAAAGAASGARVATN